MSEETTEEFLGKLAIFRDLLEEELEDLARICEEFEFEDGATIAYQRDVADNLIIVREGRLFAFEVDDQGQVHDPRPYSKGKYFEDRWLFTPMTHTATLRSVGAGRLIFIDHEKFIQFIADHPDALDNLELSDEAMHEAEGTQYAQPKRRVRTLSLLPDEIVLLNKRRSVWRLIIQLIGPIVIYAIWLGVAWGVLELQGAFALVATVIPGIFVLAFTVFQAFDWTNDYFVITNKHIMHREYTLWRFQATVNKTPIDQVQSVEIERPSLIATILNIGTARVTTAAQSGIVLFDYIDDPDEVEEIINRLREHVQALDAGRAQATMRASLEEHFGAPPPYKHIEDEEEEFQEEKEARSGPLALVASFFDSISHAISSRVIDGDVITYRKHFFTLIERTWINIAIGLGLTLLVALVPWIEAAACATVAWLANFAWFIWRFEDWRNDAFQVTGRYVIDIDRRPFGFGESRKQAELGNVQNVSAHRPGIFATIFNYGDVHIETAGATADIIFERVVNPNLVQSDIFQRREEFRQKQLVREGQRRRKEYAVMLDVFKQAQEQGRLPQRTPPDEELDLTDDRT
jgi:CRP-like cAMP-binding protein/uncharacterized membrane protein YdbT with pleckstrin-like domain